MKLEQALEIRRGTTAIIGGGGKTSLLRILGEELVEQGHTVLLCTTTKMYPFHGLENLESPSIEELKNALTVHRLVAAGTPLFGTGKLSALKLPVKALTDLADYVLVEADGSAGRPVKAHAPYEPVIPPEAGQIICVVGASGFGLPIARSAHRPELYARLAGVTPDTPVTPELEAAVLEAENLHSRVYINQADMPQRLSDAKKLKDLLHCPVTVGALQKQGGHVLCW